MRTELTVDPYKLYLGNTLEVLKTFPNDCIDCVVTSPPYYMMRRYEGIPDYIWDGEQDCEHEFDIIKTRIIGSSNPNSQVTAAKNYLKYMGAEEDKYLRSNICTKCGAWKGQLGNEPTYTKFIDHLIQITAELKRVLKPSGTMFINLGDTYRNKIALLIPSRYAIRCIDELNLTVRNDIIWHKKNAMPESVKDRYSKTYEHVLFFTKSDKYYFDLDSVRKPYAETSHKRYEYGRKTNKYEELGVKVNANSTFIRKAIETGLPIKDICPMNPLGKNPGDVWRISTKPSSKKHYATYNSELINKPILSGCPINGIVLDPFAGSGTTLATAIELDRKAIGIEGSETYYEIAKEELNKKLCNQKIEGVAWALAETKKEY